MVARSGLAEGRGHMLFLATRIHVAVKYAFTSDSDGRDTRITLYNLIETAMECSVIPPVGPSSYPRGMHAGPDPSSYTAPCAERLIPMPVNVLHKSILVNELRGFPSLHDDLLVDPLVYLAILDPLVCCDAALVHVELEEPYASVVPSVSAVPAKP